MAACAQKSKADWSRRTVEGPPPLKDHNVATAPMLRASFERSFLKTASRDELDTLTVCNHAVHQSFMRGQILERYATISQGNHYVRTPIWAQTGRQS